MRLLIAALLVAISYAQTVAVGTTDILPSDNPTIEDVNAQDGRHRNNDNLAAVWQLTCTQDSDCGESKLSGYYCDSDSSECTLCPLKIEGCVSGTFIKKVADCQSKCNGYFAEAKVCTGQNVNAACADQTTDPITGGIDDTTANGGYFCNLDSDNTNGKCTQCRYINTDMRGVANQCFSYPEWTSDNTYVTCRAACEMYERSVTPATNVDGTIPSSSRPSDMEAALGGDQGFCDKYKDQNGADVCKYGSSFSTLDLLTDSFAQFDNELNEDGCEVRQCNDQNQCVFVFADPGKACLETRVTQSNQVVDVAGTCSEGVCQLLSDSVCPDGYDDIYYDFPVCSKTSYTTGTATQDSTDVSNLQFINGFCNVLTTADGSSCRSFGRQANNVLCITESQKGGDLTAANDYFNVAYMNVEASENLVNFSPDTQWDQEGACMVGSSALVADNGDSFDCVIDDPGTYIYRNMVITYYEQDVTTLPSGRSEIATVLYVALTTRYFTQTIRCPPGSKCFGDMSCEWYATSTQTYPCGNAHKTCVKTTASPTQSPIASSHGDPIIWTFNDECYDLSKDGKYVATYSSLFDHQVNIGIYNDFMREVEVVNEAGETLLWINVNGEYDATNWPHAFEVEEKECPAEMKETECLGTYMAFRFDAQEFQYFVHLLRHDYADPALQEGELGYHLDIYPTPYSTFDKAGHRETYTGLYFENPIPEELEYCPGGSIRRQEA